MSVSLVGGGPETVVPGLLAPFLQEVRSRAARAGRAPRVVLVVVDGRGAARRFLPAYRHALDGGPALEVRPVLLAPGRPAPAGAVADVDGIVVGGGETPAYLDGLLPAAAAVGAAVRAGTPYLGFSAGAMVAPSAALVGGHLLAGRSVCPEDRSEDVAEVALRPGLGLVGFPVDVHTAEAGTLGRTVALVGSGVAPLAVGIDEDTVLTVAGPEADPADGVVSGTGAVWVVRAAPGVPAGATVQVVHAAVPAG